MKPKTFKFDFDRMEKLADEIKEMTAEEQTLSPKTKDEIQLNLHEAITTLLEVNKMLEQINQELDKTYVSPTN